MRLKLATASVLFVLAVGVVLWWSRPRRPTPENQAAANSPAPASSTAAIKTDSSAVISQSDLQALINRDGVTPERAKQLFSVVVGPLPGVTITTTPSTDPADFDGTSAVLSILGVWSSLTPEQQRAAANLIERRGGSSKYAQHDIPKLIPIGFRYIDDPKPAYDYDTLVPQADLILEKLLGVTHVSVYWVYDFDPPQGTEYAHTDYWILVNGHVQMFDDHMCHIYIHDQKMRTLTADDARAVLTHEMFHCYQQRAAGDYDLIANLRGWIKEGEPTWVMAAVVPTVRAAIDKYWNLYASSPETRFHQRDYDGIGIFGHMSDRAGDAAVWNKLLKLVVDGAGDKYGFAAFDDLIAGWETDYFQSWGSSYFLSKMKPSWDMTGPAHPPDSGMAPTKKFIPRDTPQLLDSSGPYESQVLELTTDADVLEIALLTGYGRVHDQGFALDSALDSSGPTALCLKSGGCACPDGSPGASTFTQRATAPISVGLNAGRSTGQIGVAGVSLDEFCKEPDPKPGPEPPAPGGGGGGGGPDPEPPQPEPPAPGSSHGDTHLVTFDGLKYDFQAVGEFTLVRSTKDDFVVQTRQVPVLKSKTVSVNQAIATKIGGHRVTIALENNAPVLRIDGSVAGETLPAFQGGSLTRAKTMYGTTFTLEWPDATTVRVAQAGARVLNVRVTPSRTRMGSLAGLLGDGDGSTANDLIGTGGARLGIQPSAETITHSLADAWRVTQSTSSLFDYLPGQSATTFVDSTFPDFHVDASNVPNREAAEKNCRAAGISDTRLLEDCIVDFGLTSDFLFTSTYRHEQQVLAAHARIAAKRAGLLRTVLFEGNISTPTDAPSLQFDAKAGDVVWIGQPDCTDSYSLRASLLDPTGKSIGFDALCVMGRHVLPVPGTYTLRTSSANNPKGPFSVPIRFVRSDQVRPVKNNDVVTGRIESRGIHDLYTFDGHIGDVVRVSGEGCDTGSLVLGFLLPNGSDRLGPSCRAGSDSRLPTDGPYKLVINAADGGPGEYHFVFQIVPSNAGK